MSPSGQLQLRTAAWYGDTVVELPIPAGWEVTTFRPPNAPALSDEQQRVADGYPDGFIAYVQRHDPHVFPVGRQFYTGIMNDNLCINGPVPGGSL